MKIRKRKVVEFIDGMARVITTDDAGVLKYKGREECFIDPKLTQVAGVPPELWEIQNNQIVRIQNPIKLKARVAQLQAAVHLRPAKDRLLLIVLASAGVIVTWLGFLTWKVLHG